MNLQIQHDSASEETSKEIPTASEDKETSAPTEHPEDAEVEKNGDVCILFTSDVHCGVDMGFGYAGVAQIREELEAQGYTTILVDNGDGNTAFAGATLLQEQINLDNQTLIDYIVDTLGGEINFDTSVRQLLQILITPSQRIA